MRGLPGSGIFFVWLLGALIIIYLGSGAEIIPPGFYGQNNDPAITMILAWDECLFLFSEETFVPVSGNRLFAGPLAFESVVRMCIKLASLIAPRLM